MPSVPAQAYLVCATPRSGSTLLCEMLLATGRAGRPLEHFEVLSHTSLPRQPREYFVGCTDSELLEVLAPLEPGTPNAESPEAWWAKIRAEGSSENGVWGGKLMWGHVDDLLGRVHRLAGLRDADLATALQALLGGPPLIYVTRQDRVSQAVSLWLAVQTQSWRADPIPSAQASHADNVRSPLGARYRFAGIDHLVAGLEADDRAWREWFTRSGHRPLIITYEELDRAPQETVGRVLGELGLGDVEPPTPALHRQRDVRSAEWARRYRIERERAA